MKYVLNAMQDLDKAINNAQNNIILARLSINQTLPPHLLNLENKSVALMESDFSKLDHFKDLFLSVILMLPLAMQVLRLKQLAEI